MKLKKAFYVSGVWLLPVVPKVDRNSAYIPYFITFWLLRALLSPLILIYTFRFWVESDKVFRLILIHLAGFALFSILFWASAYVILHELLFKNPLFGITNTSSNIQIFGMIADNSASVNIMVYASTVICCYVWEFFNRSRLANEKAAALEKSLLISRLELLKSQLNTHFLFNTLHTISSFVVRKQNEEANKMLIGLSDLLRFALKENKEQFITLRKEIEILNIYLEIHKTRFKDHLKVNLSYPDTLLNAMVPPLILQPIVENAIKYAVEPFTGRGVIDITIEHHEPYIHIIVKDNGKTPFHSINFTKGLGLNNTKERLEELYNGSHLFLILQNKPEGVIVDFKIPFREATIR